MIEMPRRRVGDRATLFQADMNEPLAFLEDESLDLVLSSLTLHYFKKLGTGPGGVLPELETGRQVGFFDSPSVHGLSGVQPGKLF